jgi:hypothetical protein
MQNQVCFVSLRHPLHVLYLGFVLVALHFVTESHAAGSAVQIRAVANPQAADLKCPASRAVKPSTPLPTAPPDEVEVIPSDDELRDLPRPTSSDPLLFDPGMFASRHGGPGGAPLRIGVWGDSHIAAGFFSEELARLIGTPGTEIQSTYIPVTNEPRGGSPSYSEALHESELAFGTSLSRDGRNSDWALTRQSSFVSSRQLSLGRLSRFEPPG